MGGRALLIPSPHPHSLSIGLVRTSKACTPPACANHIPAPPRIHYAPIPLTCAPGKYIQTPYTLYTTLALISHVPYPASVRIIPPRFPRASAALYSLRFVVYGSGAYAWLDGRERAHTRTQPKSYSDVSLYSRDVHTLCTPLPPPPAVSTHSSLLLFSVLRVLARHLCIIISITARFGRHGGGSVLQRLQ
ncbi:hypothetical protein BC834DRAFT_691575 [Gloeopeniophorella convolvens]|nr:hypothetical protein BC834DRAFT_691575 [Gloeopeniophorella convolvens]